MPERFLGDWPRDAFIPFSLGISRASWPHTFIVTQTLCRCPRLFGKTVRIASCRVVIESIALIHYFQILRNRRRSRHDYARVEI